MSEGVFATIRAACAEVARDARWVRVDDRRLEAYATEIGHEIFDEVDTDPGRDRFDDLETTVSFVVGLDAINFGSGYFPLLRKRPGMSGYHTIATGLREHVAQHGALAADDLCAMTGAQCAQIFGQPIDGPAQPLMDLFATALGDLGTFVNRRHNASFVDLVRSCEHSAAALVGELDRMPFFHDVASYRGREVPLYKRAQITANDLALSLPDDDLGRFDDIDQLTMFPDNLVPHVLRVDGVLVFDPRLVERIVRVEDITAGSEPEVEIRAVALHAVEVLSAALRAQGRSVTPRDLDTFLWNRGGAARYKAAPRHRTRCVYY